MAPHLIRKVSEMGKKRITKKVVDTKKAKFLKDQDGNEQFVVVEEHEYYTATNLRPGKLFFTREDGKEDVFEGKQTKTDITQKEYEMLIKTLDFANGWLVFEGDESVKNENSINNSQIMSLVTNYSGDKKKIKNIIEKMTSNFAVKRLKEALIEKDMPSSLTSMCEVRLAELEEEIVEKSKAPIEFGPRGER